MRTRRAGVPAGTCLLLLLGPIACGDSGPSDAIVTNVAQLTLADCDSARLTATVQKGGGGTDSARVIRFFSGDTTIITVDSVTGDVATRRPGNATVRVQAGSLRMNVPASVSAPAGTVTVLAGPANVAPGDSMAVAPVLASCHGGPITSGAVFAATDPAVATLTTGGYLKGVAYGVTSITGTSPEVAPTASSVRFQVLLRRILAGAPFGVRISASGVAYVTRSATFSLARYDLATSDTTGGVSVGYAPVDVAFSPTTGLAYVTNQLANSVSLVDPATNTETGTASFPANTLRVLVADDGSAVYVTVANGQLYYVDPTSLAATDSTLTGGDGNGIALHPDGIRGYIGIPLGGIVTEFSRVTHAVLRTFSPGGTSQEVVLPAGGSTLYLANEASGVQVIDLTSGSVSSTIAGTASAFAMALSPDGSLLYVVSSQTGKVAVVDVPTRTVLRTYDVGGTPRRVAVKADGSVALVANESGWVDFLR